MTVPLVMLSDNARALVRAAEARHGSLTAVARMIGYSRPSLSLAMAGRYRATTLSRMETAIAQTFGSETHCPFLERSITAVACEDFRTRNLPTADPPALKHWQACQFCSHNPEHKHTKETADGAV